MAKTIENLKTIEDFMKITGVSRDKANRLMKSGELEFFKIGWQIRFSDEQIEAFLEKCRNAPRKSRRKMTVAVA